MKKLHAICFSVLMLIGFWILPAHSQSVLCGTSTSGAATQPCAALPNGITATTQTTGDTSTDIATDAFVASAIAPFGSPVVLQSGLPFIYAPSGYVDATGNWVDGQVPLSAQTVSFSGTSGSVTATFSAATLAGTSAGDVGRQIVVLDTTYKVCAITVFSSSTVATCALSATLSGTGPFTPWVTGPVYTATNVPGASAATVAAIVDSGTTGQFTCTCVGLVGGMSLTISGTWGTTTPPTGYTTPTTYLIASSPAPTTTGFTLTTQAGTALVTAGSGTPTGLTLVVGQIFSAPLDAVHAKVYMYFPASSPIGIAENVPCVMASVATALCSNNPYVSGTHPFWPTSLTAFSGLTPSAYTTVVNAWAIGPLVSIAAGSLSVNGALEIKFSQINNNSAGFKNIGVWFSTVNVTSGSATTTTSIALNGTITNQGIATAQSVTFTQNGTPLALGSQPINTTVAQNLSLQFNAQAAGTDWVMLVAPSVKEYSY